MLHWQQSDDGTFHARGRIGYDVRRVGDGYSCFLGGRDIPNAYCSSLGDAKGWCERLDGTLPKSTIEWRQADEKHWTALRPSGDDGTPYDIFFDSPHVGRSGTYSVVIANWDRADFHHATLEDAKQQCEDLDVAPSIPRDNWIQDLPLD